MTNPIDPSAFSFLDATQRLTDPHSLTTYGRDWRTDLMPKPSIIILPKSTNELQTVVRICAQHGWPIVPSGGRTGLSGGATATKGEVVISLEKLNSILEVSASKRTIRCEAGTITQKVSEAAKVNNLYFPIDFASMGSSQIGGNIATNAGGVRVIRYGCIREWVLGLRVVLANGELLELNGDLVKNQTGYDLRSLLIGSEGTLGIISEATLKLTTPPRTAVRALIGLGDLTHCLTILAQLRDQLQSLSLCEYFSRVCLSEVISNTDLKNPLSNWHEHYVLVEWEENEQVAAQAVLGSLIAQDVVDDVVISSSSAQAQELLTIRERIPELLATRYRLHKNDISVPISSLPSFISELLGQLPSTSECGQVFLFGHIGDGNLHVNIANSNRFTDEEFTKRCRQADSKTYALVGRYHGSSAAEHGVGLLKKAYLHYSRSHLEIELMKHIKSVFDPHGIMNPGKIFD